MEEVLGADLPAGARFVEPAAGAEPGWRPGRAVPTPADLDTCVACGLCLPHCPTYRLTGEESASPRGRIAAMRLVSQGVASPDRTFASFMDACLVCRACEDVCPSHAPFGRMMEAAREQIEPTRGPVSRLLRWIGFAWILPHPSMLRAAAAVQPLVRPILPRSVRDLLPGTGHPFARLPRVTEPPFGVRERGTVALLAGCAQDRWFHEVNLATIRVLAATGWRVEVPRQQACCGALAAHNGRLPIARRLARRANHAFRGAQHVIVNAAGCSAHMTGFEDLREVPAVDLMRFLAEQGPGEATFGPVETTVAYHDACHASRAQQIRAEPRTVLGWIPGLRTVEIRDGDRCCGAAGIYNVTQPELSGALRREKAAAVVSTAASVVASANPGCTMQIAAGLAAKGAAVEVLHPVQLLDRALPV
ncbi:MAG: (Fe-S)-binding protein [Actinomycetota bacterium]